MRRERARPLAVKRPSAPPARVTPTATSPVHRGSLGYSLAERERGRMEIRRDPYETLCSLETLRSGKRGFFGEFAEAAARAAGDLWISETFGRLEEDGERLRAIFREGGPREVVLDTLSRTRILYRGKDAHVARDRRLEGLRAATAGKRNEALALLSQAVLRSPGAGKPQEDPTTAVDGGLGLPLALLARARIFAAAGENELALEDLDAAEEADPSTELRMELAQKRKECTEARREKARPCDARRKPSLPRTSGRKNPRLPGASSLLRIEETETAGKRVVAAKRIEPGDVLAVELPVAGCLLPDFYGTHCQHCFARLTAPIGCPDCSSVAFCGRRCRDVALSSYHKYECKILALLIGSGMSVLSALALRMVTQQDPRTSIEIGRALPRRSYQRSEPTVPTDSFVGGGRSGRRHPRKWRSGLPAKSPPEPPSEPPELETYDLVAHETRRSPEDFLQRTLMAAFLLKCLQRVDFFDRPSQDPEPPNEEEIAVGTVLLRNLQLLQFNAHEIYETRLGAEHRFRGSKPIYLGVAVYPTVARFNHECYPAVSRYFVGRNIVIRATRVLEPGDVVAENYGPIFTKRTLEERRRTLAGRYWFRCECTACREDWPRLENLTNDAVRLRCPTKGCSGIYQRPREETEKMTCPTCAGNFDPRGALAVLRDCEQLYARGFAKMDDQERDEAIEIFVAAAKKFHRVAIPPHLDTHLAEIALSVCMADRGNTWQPDPRNQPPSAQKISPAPSRLPIENVSPLFRYQ